MLIRELRSGRFPQPMTTRTIASPNPDAPKNPKQTYEAALGELRGEETPDRKAKTPIYRRKPEVATSTDTSPEPKRALADAAAALAALWKTSSPKAHQSINAPQGVPRSRVPCPQLKRTMHASSHMPFGGGYWGRIHRRDLGPDHPVIQSMVWALLLAVPISARRNSSLNGQPIGE